MQFPTGHKVLARPGALLVRQTTTSTLRPPSGHKISDPYLVRWHEKKVSPAG